MARATRSGTDVSVAGVTSEIQPQAALQVAGGAGAREAAEGVGGGDGGLQASEVHVVHHVERIRPELEPVALVHAKFLAQRDVPQIEAGAEDGARTCVAEASGRLGGEGSGVEPVVGVALIGREVHVAADIVGSASNARHIANYGVV